MFEIDSDKTINVTRGDTCVINVTAKQGNEPYIFNIGDVVRLNIMRAKKSSEILLSKEVTVDEETEEVSIILSSNDMKMGNLIEKPTAYWYEVVLNPNTSPETIIGYDKDGPKQFILYPEGGDKQ